MTRLFIVLALLAWPASAGAYNSKDLQGLRGGPYAAQSSWIGDDDEHRRILAEAMTRGGLPEAFLEPFSLRVFPTGGRVFHDGEPLVVEGAELYSVLPFGFDEAGAAVTRTATIAEFAQLPDLSFALWDWAAGNELCPLGEGTTAIDCHQFDTHMGAVNSNHFLPQAHRFYVYYHGLAMTRAEECVALAADLGQHVARFERFVLACEREALVLEAVGQHFLHDAWSSGHMWQRWGSPDLADFESRTQAVLVAMTSGVIHGSKAVMQEKLDEWTDIGLGRQPYDVEDPLCAPIPDVQFVPAGSLDPLRGAGDLYLAELRTQAPLRPLWNRLISCSLAGMREVYSATSQRHGPLGEIDFPGWTGVSASDEACFGQRVTNSAFQGALGVRVVDRITQGEAFFPISEVLPDLLATVVQFGVVTATGERGDVPVDERLESLWKWELMRLVLAADIAAKRDPLGTEMADLRLGLFQFPVAGVAPNDAYGHGARLAPYTDPPLPWPDTPSADGDDRARARFLARSFHEGHVAGWCGELTVADLEVLRDRAVEPDITARERAARCEVCTELAARHLRVAGPDGFAPDLEPVCRVLLGDAAASLALSPAYPMTAAEGAREWCGCPDRRVGGLAVAERHSLWAMAPFPDEPQRVSPCQGARLEVDLGTAQPVGATRAPGRGVVVRFATNELGVVRDEACAELDIDGNDATTSTGAPPGVTRYADPQGHPMRGLASVGLADGRTVALYTTHDPDAVCRGALVAVDLHAWAELGRVSLGRHPTEVGVVTEPTWLSDDPVVFVSQTGAEDVDPDCFSGQLAALPLHAVVDGGGPAAEAEVTTLVFGGAGAHRPRRMTWARGDHLLAVVLGEANGHLGVVDLEDGGTFSLGDENDWDDYWLHLSDVMAIQEHPGSTRFVLAQGGSQPENPVAPNGDCRSPSGVCGALRTVRFQRDTGEWEEGIEWRGLWELNFTLQPLPGTAPQRFVIAHHRIAVSQLYLFEGIHAFGLAEDIAGPGGTGVLFPYR